MSCRGGARVPSSSRCFEGPGDGSGIAARAALVPWPCEDSERVDALRAEAGTEPRAACVAKRAPA